MPVLMLAWREIVRFYRQPSRVVGALGSPLVFWVFLGSGLGNSFQSNVIPAGAGYLEYFYPGTLALIVLFTSIFSTISVIEDRKEGFLQSVLVSPVSRRAIVGGKVLGGSLLSFMQAALFLLFAPLLGFHLDFVAFALVLVTLFLLAFSLTSLGFLFAWKLNSVQGFHGVMNLVLFPMWLLSGALFPPEGTPFWLRFLMTVNPMTYGLSLLRLSFFTGLDGGGWPVALGITVFFSLVFFIIATWLVGRPLKIAET